MRHILVCLAALAFPAAAAEIRASLEPVKGDTSARPFALAVLAVENHLSRPIAAAALTPAAGGPMALVELPVPSGTSARYRVSLPAAEAHQEYRVRFYDAYDNGEPNRPPARLLAEAQASIDWPLETVAGCALIRPQAYAAVGSPAPAWPIPLRQQALIALAGLVVLLSFSLLVPWRAVRLLAALASVAAGGGMLWWLSNSAMGATIDSTKGHLIQLNSDGSVVRETVFQLRARRTATFTGDLDALRPLYSDRLALQHDNSMLRLGGPRQSGSNLSHVSLRAGKVQVFVGSPRSGPAAGTPPTIKATAGSDPNALVLTAGRAVPPALLVIGDRFVPIPALAAGRPQPVQLSADQPLRLLRQSPGNFGFDAQSLSLFAWWDQLHRRVASPYLVWVADQEGQTYLQAVEVR